MTRIETPDLDDLTKRLAAEFAPELPEITVQLFKKHGSVNPVIRMECRAGEVVLWQEQPVSVELLTLIEPGVEEVVEFIEMNLMNCLLELKKRYLRLIRVN